MPLSNAAKNAIQGYGKKKFPYQTEQVPGVTSGQSNPQNPAPPANSGNGRQSRIMMTMQPEPVRDVQEEDRLKKIAKVNAIGRALGSVAQLGGMASGGDAIRIEDNVSPFVMEKMNTLDTDYRNQLQDHYRRAFAVDTFNTNQQNQDITDQNDYNDQMTKIDLQAKNARELAAQRAKLAMDAFNAKTDAEKAEEMAKAGIDPSDKDAYGKYVARMNSQFGLDSNYKKSQTAQNYASANRQNNPRSSSDTPYPDQEYDLPTMKAGKDAFIRDIDAQIAKLDPDLEPEKIKALMEQRKYYMEFNPGKNKMIDSEMMQRGIREDEGKDANGDFTNQGRAPQGQPFTPGKGFNFNAQPSNPANPATTDRQQITTGLQQGFRDIASGNFDNIDQTIQYIIDIGDAANEEEAEKIIEDYIQELKNNQ